MTIWHFAAFALGVIIGMVAEHHAKKYDPK